MRRLTLVGVLLATLFAGLNAPAADASTTTVTSLLARLDVRAESGSTAYARAAFRYPIDADRDTCDTREEVLIAESRRAVRRGAACRILSGRWVSSYDGRTWTRPRDVRVDHMVPFKEAWESGARRWTRLDRQRFANDLWFGWSLNAVTTDLKAAKGTRDPAAWLPPAAKCFYVTRWVAVKYRWRLSINRAERTALAKVMKGRCGARKLAVPTRVTLGSTLPVPLPGASDSPIPNNSGDDTSPPSAPGSLSATTVGSSVSLTWAPADDDVGVTRYDVHRSGTAAFAPGATTVVGSTTATSYDDAARPAGTGYYRVVAADAAGNLSVPSNEASANVASGGPTTLFAVGDIACAPGAAVTATTCRHREVANVVAAAPEAQFVALGDLQYLNATYAEFVGAGGYDSTFGAFKARTLPVVGNHEHVDPVAVGKGYFDYFYGAGVDTGPFGARGDGYYARTVGGWQFIALNSECRADTANATRAVAGGCGVGSPQYRWLQSVLAANTARCTVVAFHRARWTTGAHASYAPMAPMWDLMVRSGVDVIVSGHNHSSEVFAPIGVSGSTNVPVRDDNGIRSFVAGSGGKSLASFRDSSSAVWQALQSRDNTTFGPLQLTLRDGSFDWQFTPIAGQAFKNAGTASYFAGAAEPCR